MERQCRSWTRRAGRRRRGADAPHRLRLGLYRPDQRAGDPAGEKIVGHAYANSAGRLFHHRRRRIQRISVQIRALLLEDQRQADKDQDHLAHPRLSRGDDGGDERHRHGRLPQDVRTAGPGLYPGDAALRLSLARQRGSGDRRGRGGRKGDPRRGPGYRRGGDRRAGDGRGRGDRAAAELFPGPARDLRPPRCVADRRRGHHRVRPHRPMVRARPLGGRARSRLLRQGGDERLSALGRRHRLEARARGDRERAGRPQIHARRDLFRPSGVLRGRFAQCRDHRERGAGRARRGHGQAAAGGRSKSCAICRRSAMCAGSA